jgi:hypothetical protein
VAELSSFYLEKTINHKNATPPNAVPAITKGENTPPTANATKPMINPKKAPAPRNTRRKRQCKKAASPLVA